MPKCVVIASCFVDGIYRRTGEEVAVQNLDPDFVDSYLKVLPADEPETELEPQKPKRKPKE